MNKETQPRDRSAAFLWHVEYRLSPPSIVILGLGTAIGVILYLCEPTLSRLLLLGSMSCFVLAYALGVAVGQFHLRNKIVVSLAFFLLFLSFSSLIGSLFAGDIAGSVSPVLSILVSTVFWLPFYLLSGNGLLRAYEAGQSFSELGKTNNPENSSDNIGS